jgi:hypothetical protein
MIMNKLKRFEIYDCTIKYRQTYEGRPLKESVKPLDGMRLELMCIWQCDPDENYPNEYAMQPNDERMQYKFRQHGISWIASGDLDIQVGHDNE